eukprot:scpid77612/ scgid32294/ 
MEATLVSRGDFRGHLEDRFTERCPDYAEVGEKVFERPVIVPWPPADLSHRHSGHNHHGSASGDGNAGAFDRRTQDTWYRRDNKSRYDDRSSASNSGSGSNYQNRRYRREPYRDLDDVREQKTKYEERQDEAEDVANFLDNYRRTMMEAKDHEKKSTEPSGKSPGTSKSSLADTGAASALASRQPSAAVPGTSSKPGHYNLLQHVLGSSSRPTKTAEPALNDAALAPYRIKPGAKSPTSEEREVGIKHHPLPHQIPGALGKKRVQRAAQLAARNGSEGSEKGGQKKVSAAAVERSRKAIRDAVQAAGGKAAAGSGTASLAKHISGVSSPQKTPRSHGTVSPVKASPKASPVSSRRASASSPHKVSSPGQNSPGQLRSELMIDESRIVLRVAGMSSPAKISPTVTRSPPEMETVPPPVITSEPPLKLSIRLPPPPPEFGNDTNSASEKVKKHHKKHKKHKRHHDSLEMAPAGKKAKLH